MERYENFSPTPFDSKGLNLHDQQDWLVLLGRNRDSDHLTNSNFECALEQLGGEGEDVEVHRFGHWAVGWLEIIIVRPGTEAERIAEEIERGLENYPVLDEEDYSRREWEGFHEDWDNWICKDFREAVHAHFAWREDDDDYAEETFFCAVDDVSNDTLFDEYSEEARYASSADNMEPVDLVVKRIANRVDVRDWIERLRNLELGITTGPQHQDVQLYLEI